MMKLVQDDSVAGSRPQRAGVWKMEGESNVRMGQSKPILPYFGEQLSINQIFQDISGYLGYQSFAP
jgi:hypothetical protein